MHSVTDPEGQAVSYSYDAAKRVTGVETLAEDKLYKNACKNLPRNRLVPGPFQCFQLFSGMDMAIFSGVMGSSLCHTPVAR